MKLNTYELNALNITIVYDKLDRDNISRDTIRKVITEKPIINDLPDVLIVIYQQNNIQVIFDQQRIAINATYNADDSIDSLFSLIANIAKGMTEAVKENNIIAYGFNYSGSCKVELEEKGIIEYFKGTFLKSPSELLDNFGGDIIKVAPRFSLKNDEYEFNISLEPADNDNQFIYHLNSHFTSNRIPSSDELVKKIKHSYVLFKQLLEKM